MFNAPIEGRLHLAILVVCYLGLNEHLLLLLLRGDDVVGNGLNNNLWRRKQLLHL